MDVKPDVEFGGDGRGVQCVNNTGEDNGHVIVGKIDLLEDLRELADHRFHEMEISGAKGSS